MPRMIGGPRLGGLQALTLVVLLGLTPCRADTGHETQEEPPSRIGAFFGELVGYLKRHDRVDVGDVAPDFTLVPLRLYDFGLEPSPTLQNTEEAGLTGVRLSDFRGKRPVALVFGSYT